MSLQRPKFRLYEKVRIVSSHPKARKVTGKVGAIVAFYEDEEGCFAGQYAVHIYEIDETWGVPEEELISLGEFDREENFVSDVTIHVDSQGNILPDEDESTDWSEDQQETGLEDDETNG